MEKDLVSIVVLSEIPYTHGPIEEFRTYKGIIEEKGVKVDRHFLVYSPEMNNLGVYVEGVPFKRGGRNNHEFAYLAMQYLHKTLMLPDGKLWVPPTLEELNKKQKVKVENKSIKFGMMPPYIILTAPRIEAFAEKLVERLGYLPRIIRDS